MTADDYQHLITAHVSQALHGYRDQIEALLVAMPVGATLCVHEEPTDAFDPHSDTFAIRAKTHVLPAGTSCTRGREQYGPKTAEVEAQMQAMLEGRQA